MHCVPIDNGENFTPMQKIIEENSISAFLHHWETEFPSHVIVRLANSVAAEAVCEISDGRYNRAPSTLDALITFNFNVAAFHVAPLPPTSRNRVASLFGSSLPMIIFFRFILLSLGGMMFGGMQRILCTHKLGCVN